MHVSAINSRYVHMTDAQVTLEKYADGSLALCAADVDEDGLPNEETFSMNLSHYDMRPPKGHVFVKDYSEHEGLAQALVNAGLVRIVEPITFGPFGTGYLVEITDATLRFALDHGIDASKDASDAAIAEANELTDGERAALRALFNEKDGE